MSPPIFWTMWLCHVSTSADFFWQGQGNSISRWWNHMELRSSNPGTGKSSSLSLLGFSQEFTLQVCTGISNMMFDDTGVYWLLEYISISSPFCVFFHLLGVSFFHVFFFHMKTATQREGRVPRCAFRVPQPLVKIPQDCRVKFFSLCEILEIVLQALRTERRGGMMEWYVFVCFFFFFRWKFRETMIGWTEKKKHIVSWLILVIKSVVTMEWWNVGNLCGDLRNAASCGCQDLRSSCW